MKNKACDSFALRGCKIEKSKYVYFFDYLGKGAINQIYK